MKRIFLILLLCFCILLSKGSEIPTGVRILYEYDAFEVLAEEGDATDFLKGFDTEVNRKMEKIKSLTGEALSIIHDRSISDKSKLEYLEYYITDLNRSHFGMVTVYEPSSVTKIANRLTELENTHTPIPPPNHAFIVFYMVLIDYENHTDTLSMSQMDSSEINYKGNYYKSSPLFFYILDLIRDRDPIWRKENEMFYKGHGNVNYGTVR